MDDEMRKFLLRLAFCGGHARVSQLPELDRGQDLARKRCKARDWAYFRDGYWHLTPVGYDALSNHEKVGKAAIWFRASSDQKQKARDVR